MRFKVLKPYQAVRFAPEHTLPGRGRTLTLPGFRQTRTYSCGFASALMVLRYFERDLPAAELFDRLGTGRDGTRQTSIVRELRNARVSANVRYDVDFDRLQQVIDRGKLIIGYLEDMEHWLVVYGYGLDPARVFVADPRPNHRCEHLWGTYGPRLGGFGIVCSAREMELVTNITDGSDVTVVADQPGPHIHLATSGERPSLSVVKPAAAPRIAQLSFDFLDRQDPESR